MITKEKAIELLNSQISEIDGLKRQKRFSQNFKKWQRDTEICIEHIFGKQTRHMTDFTKITYHLRFVTNLTTDYEKQTVFIEGLETAETVLESMIDEIEKFGDFENCNSIEDAPLIKIKRICNRFHYIAKQIRARHDNRPTINIEDEYDVQDLLHAILKLDFDDIRPEEWTPSYAGKSARMDFLLKKEGIVIEVKKTRKGLTEREIGDQLLIDIARYKIHQSCKYLICFIYDPEGRISNSTGMESDLKSDDDIKVITIISPK
jgi:hypothetical protein